MPSIDRLSALPDCVLCHILSFLPTKLSVATSILARRWRFLWAHVPILDFEYGSLMTQLDVGERFLDIINRVLLLYKVHSINTFRLCYAEECNEYRFETCITAAIVRNVKNLDLHLQNQVSFPRCIFNCKTVVCLTLCYCGYIPDSGAVCLPALKRLHLEKVQYESTKSLPYMLSGCPVIEELIIDRCVDEPDIVCCRISSPTVKSLVLNSNFEYVAGSFGDPYSIIKIDTPALRYLQVQDSTSDYFLAGSLTSLIQADVVFGNVAPTDGDILYSRSVLEFVGRLCNVKCLKLSTGWMEVPNSKFSASTIKFDNLTKLELACDWRFLSYFLENADNLEVIIFCKVDIDLNCWMEPRQVPACLLSHLRTVRIDQFGSTEQVFMMVKYILRNAKVLEKMEIYSEHHGTDFKAKFDALKRISSFQRGSEACELVFH
ncbi:hypothetical protein DH2020_031729 [Rehmannia glutinosa]|uniref:FBD domain-containing protein n=1 Tax=Rehmannia glutinosa TaxID=99300 RepID=A0ABR0VH44_REHGL